ncbi:hypothetical protein QR98_0084600 [Sarcoptes scabiei]|uniref:DSCAM/DSCAML C-terminal domain-containing protein n=1 Tax=Sarcoptes scabiei TaxID=52283 RepID=A0A132AG07_SARSC|nr:hypothetical protein QR98_0084600 [Sarcoptes scabiei]
MLPENEKLIVRDLPSGTWYDMIIAAQNDAGKREAEFSFATLTETGATIEPLHTYESRMSSIYGVSGSGNSFTMIASMLDDPMIFIPAVCTVIVLVVVISTSIFLYLMRIRQETLQQIAVDESCYIILESWDPNCLELERLADILYKCK